MNPTARILCLCLICIFAAACQPSPARFSPLSSAAAAFPSCADQSITTGEEFVSQKAFFLSPKFDPRATIDYQAGLIAAKEPVFGRDPYSTDLAGAWKIAPPFFREYLCGLSRVFIVANNCSSTACSPRDLIDYSWGFREHPPQILNTQTPGRYVAISAQLWQGNPLRAPPLSDYETRRLRYLLGWPLEAATGLSIPRPPVFAADPDTGQMSVLASLAHGFGHVYWWDAFVQTPGGDIKPSSSTACNTDFYSNSWQKGPALPPNRWVYFGDVFNNYHKADDVNMVEFFKDLRDGSFDTKVAELLHAIYSGQLPDKTNTDNGRWASALAAYSTDEDFVETFQLYVLMKANTPLKNLPITIYRREGNPYVDDIPSNLKSKSVLAWKMSCFGPLPTLPPSP